MPGPGRKNKAKRSGPSTSQTPAQYIGDIDNARDWNHIVLILCDFFKLPDLTTRSGLKKVHADFDAIVRRLDQVYNEHGDNERIAGGIVGIYAKMCADSILRNKLFQRGFLSKLLPLLDKPYHLILPNDGLFGSLFRPDLGAVYSPFATQGDSGL